MNHALHLSQLQKIDLNLDQITRRLIEIEQIIAGDLTIHNAEENLKNAKSEAEKANFNLSQADKRVINQRVKIETNESALYAGKINNPKELQDLQNDIASLKKYLIVLEDQLLDSMIAVESSQARLAQAEKALAMAQSHFAEQQAGLLGEKNTIEQQKLRLLAERTACLAQISAEILAVYEHLRLQKRGVALSIIEDGACKSCGSILRPAELQEAHSPDKLVFCSSCGRIIYIG